MWRFPYLAGQYGGPFIAIFVLVCLAITTPILAAEFMLGRRGRRSPPEATGAVALEAGRSPRWSVIGWVGSLAMFLIMTYYGVIGGWVLAYIELFATNDLAGLGLEEVGSRFTAFLAEPWALARWHFTFMAITVVVSALGLERGIELANKIMIPGLFILLLLLLAYSFAAGDLEQGVPFIFRADWSAIDGRVVLMAVGQAFYATGIGMAIMIAYGAYIPANVSLLRSGAVVSGSIIAASILASLVIFPLAFRYGIDPAQGPELAFIVLPNIFVNMPGGAFAGFAFFVLLAFAALSSALAGIEPTAGILRDRLGMRRPLAVCVAGGAMWLAGLPVVLSFNAWADARPLAGLPRLGELGIFQLVDYGSANVLLPVCALLTCILVAWRLGDDTLRAEFGLSGSRLRLYRIMLGVICPLAILSLAAVNL